MNTSANYLYVSETRSALGNVPWETPAMASTAAKNLLENIMAS